LNPYPDPKVVPPEAKYDAFEIGDKIMKVSASFGNEVRNLTP